MSTARCDAQGYGHKLRSLVKARAATARAVLTLREQPESRPVDEADYHFVDKLATFTTLLVDTA